jgi:mono/diheme cytochrome c family protein
VGVTGVRWFVSLALLAGLGQAVPPPKKGGNPDAAKVRNPVEATPESAAAGRRAYVRLCVRCHGPEGKGDGEAAAGATPSDLTAATPTYGSSDGEIFSVIHDGTSADMAGYAERLSDAEIWNVVNYIRTLRRRP